MWEVACAWTGTNDFEHLLAEGWEPFAVDPPTPFSGTKMWFKRRKP